MWNEFLIYKKAHEVQSGEKNIKLESNMTIGAGLHYFHGVSRLSNASTLNFLCIDAPIFNWYNIELTDQFARQFGIFLKGKLRRLDYRLFLNKPFNVDQTAAISLGRAVHAPNGRNSFGGYAMYQFLDQESNVLPFTVGSYVGTRKVFNIGVGFYQHPEATATGVRDAQGALTIDKRHSETIFGADVFADLPIGKKGVAITAYGMYYNMDFGPNYYRSVGIMNLYPTYTTPRAGLDPLPANQRSIDGAGDARTLLGTGNLLYLQGGLLLPKDMFGEEFGKKMRIQPMGSLTGKNFEFIQKQGLYYDIGTNFYLDGHHAKFTVQWSSRPVIVNTNAGTGNPANNVQSGRRGELLMQMQVWL